MERNEFLEKAASLRSHLARVASMITSDPEVIQDAVSDAILKGCEKRDTLRDPEKMKSWLSRIVVHSVSDHYRRDKSSNEDTDTFEDSGTSIAGRSEQIELIETILDSILEMTHEEYRDAMLLYFYRRLEYQEIADELKISLGTVKSRLNRGRQALRASLESKGIRASDMEKISSLDVWPGILLVG